MTGLRFRATGRVQGVSYRAFTVHTARLLGLRGWVRNVDDGSVEGCAWGPPDALAALLDALRRGPPAARVTGVDVAEAEGPAPADFTATATVAVGTWR